MLQTILQTDLAAWCISAAVLLFGCWLQTALGFGMAVAAAPVIVLVKPEWVPVVLTVTALQLSVINTWNQRHAVQLKPMAWAFVTRIPGTVTGAWLLVQLNVQWLQIFVAVSVILAVVLSLWSVHFEATPKRQALAGYFSGLMGTTTSIGGPPMALVMQHGEPSTIRANLSLFFTYSCILSLLSYWFADLLTVLFPWL